MRKVTKTRKLIGLRIALQNLITDFDGPLSSLYPELIKIHNLIDSELKRVNNLLDQAGDMT